MLLYKNKKLFSQLITNASIFFDISSSIIEKDYYVSLFLNELNKNYPNLIFKGGTSLSKCFCAIDRFSEDIDISSLAVSIGQRKEIKNQIIKTCEVLNFKLQNLDGIYSHRKFNRYYIDYPRTLEYGALHNQILVETTFFTKPFPVIVRNVTNYLYQYLKNNDGNDLIQRYEDLKPFEIKTQSLERTFIDKIYALCDYYLRNIPQRNSRHIYDLYCLFDKIQFDNNFLKIKEDVYKDRTALKNAVSAKRGININAVLKEIIDSNYYKKDYINITSKIIITPIKYELIIEVLNKIIKLNIF